MLLLNHQTTAHNSALVNMWCPPRLMLQTYTVCSTRSQLRNWLKGVVEVVVGLVYRRWFLVHASNL